MGQGFEIPIRFSVDVPAGPMAEFFNTIKRGAEESGAALTKVDASALAGGFIAARSEIAASLSETKAAAAALVAAGQGGSESYQLAIAKVRELNEEEANLGKALRKVEEDGKPAESLFSRLKEQAGDLAKTAGGVFAGGALLGGVSGIASGIESLFEKGKQSLEVSEQMTLGFKQAKLEGAELTTEVSRANAEARKLADEFAIPGTRIKEISGQVAFLGGVTGEQNAKVTELVAGLEKATKGSLSADQTVRIFTKGLNDPEAQASLGRLAAKFPALAEAIKTATTPAEALDVATKQLGPTFDALREQADGPLGSLERFDGVIGGLQKTIGVIIIGGLQPFISVLGKAATFINENILPAISGMGTTGKIVTGILIGLPVAFVAGTAAMGVFGNALSFVTKGFGELGISIGGVVAEEETIALSTEQLAVAQESLVAALAQGATAQEAAAVLAGEYVGAIDASILSTEMYVSAQGELVSINAATLASNEAYQVSIAGGLTLLEASQIATDAYVATLEAAGVAQTDLAAVTAAGAASNEAFAASLLVGATLEEANIAATEAYTASLGVAAEAEIAAGEAGEAGWLLALGPIGLLIAAIALVTAAAAYYFTSTEGGEENWTKIKDAVANFYELAKPALKEVGGILLAIGSVIWQSIITPFQFAWAIVSVGIDLIGDLISGLFGASDGSDEMAAAFGSISDVLATVKIGIESTVAAFSALKDGLIDILKKLLSGDISGAADAAGELGGKISTAFTQKFSDGVQEHAAQKIQDGLDKALSNKGAIDLKVKANLDVAGDLGRFEEAKAKIQEITDKLAVAKTSGDSSAVKQLTTELGEAQDKASGFAESLGKAVPSAVSGVKTVVDSTGHLKTVYDVNTAAVEASAKAAAVAYGAESQKATAEYSKGIEQLSGNFNAQSAELDKLGAAINNGTATKEQIARFAELNGKVGESRDALTKAFTDGAKSGTLTDGAIKAISVSLKISEADARKLADEQRRQAEESKNGAKSVGELSAEFEGLKKKADESYKKAQEALAALILQGKQGGEEFRKVQAEESAAYAQKQSVDHATQAADIDFQKGEAKKLALSQIETERQKQEEILKRRYAGADQAALLTAAENKLAETTLQKQNAVERKYGDLTAADAKLQRDALARLREEGAAKVAQATAAHQVELLQITQAGQKSERDSLAAHLQLEIDLFTHAAERGGAITQEAADTRLKGLRGEYDTVVAEGDKMTEAIRGQYDAQLSLAESKNAAALRDFVEKTPEYIAEQKRIAAELAVGRIKTAEDAVAQLDAFRANQTATVAATNQGYKDLVLSQTLAIGDSLTKTLEAAEDARIAGIPDRIERESQTRQRALQKQLATELKAAGDNEELQGEARAKYAAAFGQLILSDEIARETDAAERTRLIRLLAAQKAYDEAIAAAKGNHTLELQALTTFQQAKLKAEQDHFRESNQLLGGALDIASNLYRGFYQSIDPQRQKDLIAQRDVLNKSTADLIIALNEQKVSLQEYFSQKQDLDTKSAEATKQIAGDGGTFIQNLNVGLSAGFGETVNTFLKHAESSGQTFSSLAGLSNDQLKDLGKTNDDVTSALTDSWKSAGADLTATTLRAAVDGKDIAQSAADAAIEIAEKTLESQIPGLIALIFGKAFAEDPLTGGIVAGIATAALYGLVGLARKALHGGKAMAEGGLITGSTQMIRVNDDPHQRPEFVMSGGPTAAWLPQFEAINKGADPFTVFGRDEPPSWYIDAQGVLTQGFAGLAALHSRLDEHGQRVGAVESAIRAATALDIQGALRYRHDFSVVDANEEFMAQVREQTAATHGVRAEVRELKEMIARHYETPTDHDIAMKRLSHFTADELSKLRAATGKRPLVTQADILADMVDAIREMKDEIRAMKGPR